MKNLIYLETSYDGKMPVPCARPRKNKSHVYNDPKYMAYKAALANFIKGKFASEIAIIPTKYDMDPNLRKDWVKENRFGLLLLTYVKRKTGDNDNYLKTVQDALQDSGIIVDDKQIDWSFTSTLIDQTNPRVDIILVRSPISPNKLVWKIFSYIKNIFLVFDKLKDLQ